MGQHISCCAARLVCADATLAHDWIPALRRTPMDLRQPAVLAWLVMDRLNVRETARAIRTRSNSTHPPYSTRQIIEACFPGATVSGRTLPGSIQEAVALAPDGTPAIVYNRVLPTPHQRFVIAHALAHVMWDLPSEAHSDAQEERADWFAAELLLPLAELEMLVVDMPTDREEYLDAIDQIASTYHVPTEIVTWRIEELKLFAF